MTDHDPMLDGITRWRGRRADGDMYQDELGPWVVFSDLPALIAAVREDERQRVTSDFAEYLRHMEEWQAGYNKGHAAGVEQGQREGWQAGFDYAWLRGMQAQRDEVTYAETDDAYEQGQRDEREACIDTVWLVRDEKGYSNPEWQKRIVAAIQARSDGGES